MRTIWKYKLTGKGMQTIDMPKGATPAAVHAKGNNLCLWAMVDIKAPLVSHRFLVAFTGDTIALEDNPRYIGTAHLQSFIGEIVVHIFDLGEQP